MTVLRRALVSSPPSEAPTRTRGAIFDILGGLERKRVSKRCREGTVAQQERFCGGIGAWRDGGHPGVRETARYREALGATEG